MAFVLALSCLAGALCGLALRVVPFAVVALLSVLLITGGAAWGLGWGMASFMLAVAGGYAAAQLGYFAMALACSRGTPAPGGRTALSR